MPIINVRDNEIINEKEMQKTQQERRRQRTKRARGTEDTVKGWELNVIFIQAILSFVLSRKIINIYSYIPKKLKSNITGFYSCGSVKIRMLSRKYRYLLWLHYYNLFSKPHFSGHVFWVLVYWRQLVLNKLIKNTKY